MPMQPWFDHHAATMALGNGADDGQPETGTRQADIAATEKSLTSALLLGDGDAGAVILDRQPNVAFLLFDMHGHLPILGGVANGVVQQV